MNVDEKSDYRISGEGLNGTRDSEIVAGCVQEIKKRFLRWVKVMGKNWKRTC